MTYRSRQLKEWLTHERTIATFLVIVLPLAIYLALGPRIGTHGQLESWCEETTGEILRREYGKAENWSPFMGGGLGDQMRIVGTWDVAGHGEWIAACHSMPGGLEREAGYGIGPN